MADKNDRYGWDEDEDLYWSENYHTRPYASGKDYKFYQPAYRYGSESAGRFKGRQWEDVQSDLSRSWSSYEHRGTSTWEQIKDAVRDAWDRVTGKHTVGTR